MENPTGCCVGDGGRPPGVADQAETPNHRKLRRHNGRGGERCGKVAPGVRQVGARKANMSDTTGNVSKGGDDVKTEGAFDLGRSSGETCLPPERRPAYRWREPGSGSCVERWNLSPDTAAVRMRAAARGRPPMRFVALVFRSLVPLVVLGGSS